MDPVTAAGLASAIVTFVALVTKVAARIEELSDAGGVPHMLRSIRTRLPLILSIVVETQKIADNLVWDERKKLEVVITVCFEQVRQLENILHKITAKKGDSKWKIGY